ncbi:MAG TPA: hypothetical protein VK961_12410 [Chthoniobacter sp.]|nr:hypothetical protein [Chthoniobacter sp.]
MSSLEAFLNHPIETLERALHIRRQIDQLNEVLKGLFGPTPVSLAGIQTSSPAKRGRPRKIASDQAVIVETKKPRKMSAAGRARIAAAQKARWAKVKGTKSPAPVEVPQEKVSTKRKKKRKLSPESRARIVAAVKARWEKAKKAKQ